MSIEDLIANPVVTGVGRAYSEGAKDRQEAQANSLDFMIKQFGYQEMLKNVELNGLERQLKTGATKFQLKNQQDNMEREQDAKSLDDEMAVQEQLVRGLNNPSTYAGYAEIYKDHLTPDFFDKEGNPLPFEDTSRQRSTMHKSAMDSIDHLRKLDIARVTAGMKVDGYAAASPTNFQAEAAHDRVSKLISDNGLHIGELTGKSPSDAKLAKRAVAELTVQVAKKIADKGGIPKEAEIADTLISFIKDSVQDNPKNKEAYGPLKWQYDDQVVDWEKFNQKVNNEWGISGGYSSPAGAYVSGPARFVMPEVFAKERGITVGELNTLIKNAAKEEGKSEADIKKEFGIK